MTLTDQAKELGARERALLTSEYRRQQLKLRQTVHLLCELSPALTQAEISQAQQEACEEFQTWVRAFA